MRHLEGQKGQNEEVRARGDDCLRRCSGNSLVVECAYDSYR